MKRKTEELLGTIAGVMFIAGFLALFYFVFTWAEHRYGLMIGLLVAIVAPGLTFSAVVALVKAPLLIKTSIKRSIGLIKFRSVPVSYREIRSRMSDTHGQFLGYHLVGHSVHYDWSAAESHELHVTMSQLIFELRFDIEPAMARIAYAERPRYKDHQLHCVREEDWNDFKSHGDGNIISTV